MLTLRQHLNRLLKRDTPPMRPYTRKPVALEQNTLPPGATALPGHAMSNAAMVN